MSREPAVIVGTATGIVAAIITALVAFGVDLTTEQQVAVLGVVAAIAPIVAAVVTRSKVTATAAVHAFNNGKRVVAGPASPIPNDTPVNVTQEGVT